MPEVTINKYDNTVALFPVEKGDAYILHKDVSWWVTIMRDGKPYKTIPINLPLGKWEILFRHSERELEKYCKLVRYNELWYDYGKGEYACFSANSSYLSLLRAHSIQLTENQDCLIIKNTQQ